MYISLPCLPLEFRSKLDSIFLLQIVHSSDVKEYKPEVIYGIEIDIDGKLITILFKVALIIGDNLGLNSILGFTTSFNSNFFCRFCKVTKNI
ncbi:uncharacterized protein, partial [Mycetomoellerius zeteki]|uniref:uncharacterized protein n=1 Tax=Mycetomoellerius zeteki TaxID=64791 RepID=UPI00084EA56C